MTDNIPGLEKTSVEIPAERTVQSEHDILLKPHDFIFNPGHITDIATTGIVEKKNLYKVTGELEKPSVYGVIDLDTVLESPAYQGHKQEVLHALVQSFGDEF